VWAVTCFVVRASSRADGWAPGHSSPKLRHRRLTFAGGMLLCETASPRADHRSSVSRAAGHGWRRRSPAEAWDGPAGPGSSARGDGVHRGGSPGSWRQHEVTMSHKGMPTGGRVRQRGVTRAEPVLRCRPTSETAQAR
jgi:hypothetical protein